MKKQTTDWHEYYKNCIHGCTTKKDDMENKELHEFQCDVYNLVDECIYKIAHIKKNLTSEEIGKSHCAMYDLGMLFADLMNFRELNFQEHHADPREDSDRDYE